MHRLGLSSARRARYSAPLAARFQLPTQNQQHASASQRAYGTSSAPKEAESASAESGGSRSMDAKENAEHSSSPIASVVPDGLTDGDARGRTGGGKPLASSHAPPPQPKIHNASVHGGTANMTDEQRAEVDAHNAEFDKKHGKAQPAADDKVDKSFWSGEGSRTS